MPCVVKPPANTFLYSSAPGSFNRSFTTVMDFVPTFLELAGISMPPAREMKKVAPPRKDPKPRQMTTFRGKEVHAVRGKSWMPYFGRGKRAEADEMWSVHPSTEPVGWELFARGALRKGEWKIVHFPKDHGGAGVGDNGWELFNVVKDPGETEDLAEAEPEKLKELLAHWDEYAVECGIVWGDTAVAPGLAKDEAPQFWQDELDLQKAWMGARGGDLPKTCA